MHLSRLCFIFILALVVSVSFAQPAQSSQDGKAATIQPEAWEIVMLANQARTEQGAGPLKWDPALGEAARRHCLRMAAEGPISHRYGDEPDLSQRAGQAGAHFSLIEENVALGQTPASIHNGWMNSPGHRTNLMNPEVDRVGVAVVASRGVLYAVADYTHGVQALTQVQVETAVAALLRAKGIQPQGDPTDARAYCIQNKGAIARNQPAFRMLWQEANQPRLPKSLLDRIATRQYRQAAVGSCPAQDVEGSFTAYRVAVLLY
jgi:hypothetical protein